MIRKMMSRGSERIGLCCHMLRLMMFSAILRFMPMLGVDYSVKFFWARPNLRPGIREYISGAKGIPTYAT